MKTTIDKAGRIVIPKTLREQAGLTAGAPLEVRLDDGAVIIEPAYLPVRLERRGRVMVAVPLVPVPPLTAKEVRKTLERLRNERGKG